MIYYEDITLDKKTISENYIVDKQEMVEFAQKWDPQPFHTDEEAASQWPMGLTGSSTYSYALLTKLQTEIPGDKPAIVAGLGIDEWRTPTPLKAGDSVHSESWVESKRESKSKPGMGILVSVSQLINQNGDIILSYKSTGIVLKRPEEQ